MQAFLRWLVRHDVTIQIIGIVACAVAFFATAYFSETVRTALAVVSILVLSLASYAKITVGDLPKERRRIEQISLPLYLAFVVLILWLGIDVL